jgi:hypothetical protein
MYLQIPYFIKNKYHLKISISGLNYSNFDQNYKDVGQHYMQKKGCLFLIKYGNLKLLLGF